MNKKTANLADENQSEISAETDGVDSETTPDKADNHSKNQSFEAMSEQKADGIVGEFIDFLRNNKKWWLTPIIIALLLVGLLIGLTTTGAAPFLYPFW